MKLTDDESRALTFITGLLLLSLAVRIGAAREPVDVAGAGAVDLAAHTEAARAAVEEGERRARALGPGERIDPNAADAVELDRLPRIGPALADRIVADRERNGPFRTVEDLRRVRGVGTAVLEGMRPHLEISAAARRGGLHGGMAGRTHGAAGGPPAVDINTADTAALRTLPGIGPALAARIVAYRDSAGPFRDLEELAAVRGIGPATVERLRDRAVVQ